jgi:tetratricopeptide (TPR) repeat protein
MNIAVYAICKNESAHIDRFMDACEGADSVTVLDTGSSDDSVIRLRNRGASVIQEVISPWRFDQARNQSLTHVPNEADMCVSVDLDEVLSGNWRSEIESAWRPGITRIHHFMNSDGHEYLEHRVHARKGYFWRNAVHEQLVCTSHENVGHCSMMIWHKPDVTKSRAQYSDLLQLVRQESPNNFRNFCYIVIDLLNRGKNYEATSAASEALEIKKVWQIDRSYIAHLAAGAMKNECDFGAEEAWLQLAVTLAPTWREAWYHLGKLYMSVSRYEDASRLILHALKLTEKVYANYMDQSAWGPQIYIDAVEACAASDQRDEAFKLLDVSRRLYPECEKLHTLYVELLK